MKSFLSDFESKLLLLIDWSVDELKSSQNELSSFILTDAGPKGYQHVGILGAGVYMGGTLKQDPFGAKSTITANFLKEFCKTQQGWRAPWDQNEVMICPSSQDSLFKKGKQKFLINDFLKENKQACAETGFLIMSENDSLKHPGEAISAHLIYDKENEKKAFYKMAFDGGVKTDFGKYLKEE